MKFKIRNILVLLATLSLIIAACNETTTPSVVKPDAPTSLMATSIDSATVRLKWTLSTSESTTGFTGYTLYIGPGPFQPISIQKGTNTYDVKGLNEGTIYSFTLYANIDTVQSANAASIQWSPASRFVTNVNDATIKLYETASNFGSGLELYDESGGAPKTLTVASGSNWNLALDTRTDGKTIVASPTLINYNYGSQPPITQISSDYFDNLTSLDDVFDSQALDAGNFDVRAITLEDLGITANTGVVFILRTKVGSNSDYTYAKVLIKNVNGSWLQGTSPDRYIECVVSYQKTPGVPYAY